MNLLYNLLNWAQAQTGQMPYQPTPFDLAAELRKSDVSLLRNMAERKDISFIVAIPDEAIVTGDANMLLTVVRNLLTNAIKFTAPGGTVTLDVSPCRNGKSCVSTDYIVSVSDTGVGMSGEQIRNLFSIDRQHSRRGTTGETGAGLGLIVCRELLGKHGSELHIKSEVGKGSHFWFELKNEKDPA